MQTDVEETLSSCIDQLIAGASLQEVLDQHPQYAAVLAPALRDAQLVLRSAPMVEPAKDSRDHARLRMLNQLRTAEGTKDSGASWLRAFDQRSGAFRAAAIAGAVALFGAMAIGAAAATGNAPEPVREFFRGSGTSGLRVEFEGVIVGIDPTAGTFDIGVGDDVRTVRVIDSTELTRGGDPIAFGDFSPGDQVEVKGALQLDDTIIATRVHLEDGLDDGDDDDDLDEDADNSGPGNAEDEDDDGNDDNAGPGNGDEDDDDSGPGNADDDDDQSGPGNGEGAEDDENSGPGSGDDDGDDGGADSGSDDDSDEAGEAGSADSDDSGEGDDAELDD
jgi:hypothetical protein